MYGPSVAATLRRQRYWMAVVSTQIMVREEAAQCQFASQRSTDADAAAAAAAATPERNGAVACRTDGVMDAVETRRNRVPERPATTRRHPCLLRRCIIMCECNVDNDVRTSARHASVYYR